ncbi:hypothetical protein DFA_05205 [Cavenderia fasciculata]|uniref:Uncharacterized protein n=1 Tax=Cavenderia fasciculata TaxID=261658 RepID=F4PNM2_CACFS|nr:uncharacterized protein DFA_05205 [Cavenderia fasciculata]EGG23075.1 hypothetical protein DFA_05205 [Cavenderia fasciculata]|eukprot:XP_004360926.1 hypothetical protein DFA_05205 [Cavenderia fasciculata]
MKSLVELIGDLISTVFKYVGRVTTSCFVGSAGGHGRTGRDVLVALTIPAGVVVVGERTCIVDWTVVGRVDASVWLGWTLEARAVGKLDGDESVVAEKGVVGAVANDRVVAEDGLVGTIDDGVECVVLAGCLNIDTGLGAEREAARSNRDS